VQPVLREAEATAPGEAAVAASQAVAEAEASDN